MLTSHYPLAFATQWNWLIAALIFLEGVVIRHWFNSKHARKGNPHWTWAAAVIIFLVIAWLSSAGRPPVPEEVDPNEVDAHTADLVRSVVLRAIASDGRIREEEMTMFDLLDELLPGYVGS